MGGVASSSGKAADLDGVMKSAASRLGTLAISGRFHKAPKELSDSYIVKTEVLGSGYNGSVFKATAKEGGLTYAVKDFKLTGLNAEKRAELEGECEIFLSLDHPHVARLVDIYQSEDQLRMVMECMEGGELFDRVLSKKKFTEKDAADATYQMLLAVNYIHSHGIVHRDIKLENFLYEKPDSDFLKLIDFGFSKVWNSSTKMKMSCGTLAYVAPEVLGKSYTDKCDMWSLGVVVFIILCGYMPFSGSEQAQQTQIKSGKFTVKDGFKNLSPLASDFITKLILVDPTKRMSAEEALKHDFITKRSDLAKAAETAEVDASVVSSLQQFAHASKFKRACLSAMAWSLTNEERMVLRKSFMAIDTSNNGVITLAEFKAVVEEHFEVSDDKVNEMFASMDTSSTEEIHYTDFLAAMVASRVQMHDHLLKSAFKRFDADNTGFITAEDLKVVLGETYEGTEVTALLAEADVDHDGKISYEEFIAFVKSDGAQETRATEVAHSVIDKQIEKEGGFFKKLQWRK